jgi:hypothetical protein
MLSRVVGRSGVAPVFEELMRPGELVKVAVDPRQS